MMKNQVVPEQLQWFPNWTTWLKFELKEQVLHQKKKGNFIQVWATHDQSRSRPSPPFPPKSLSQFEKKKRSSQSEWGDCRPRNPNSRVINLQSFMRMTTDGRDSDGSSKVVSPYVNAKTQKPVLHEERERGFKQDFLRGGASLLTCIVLNDNCLAHGSIDCETPSKKV